MSSETKSRAGLREAIEQVMKLYAGHGDGNPPEYGLPTLRKAWREVREALESSSSADTGGRERYLTDHQKEVEEAAGMNLDWSMAAGAEASADTGTTGAEGLRELVENSLQTQARMNEHANALHDYFAHASGTIELFDWIEYHRKRINDLRRVATQRSPVTPPAPAVPQGGPFSESLKKSSRDCVWIVEQNGRVHSVHSTHESAMKEQGENLRIGVPWQVLPWAIPAPVTTPGRDEGSREVKLRRALRKYGVHQGRCEAFPGECTCGLEAALAAAKEPRG